jgi:restriction endonuclease Mrr
MSEQLRSAILLLLSERFRADPSRTVDDTDVASELGVRVPEVQIQLDILEDQGLTNEANTFEGNSAWISPRGLLAIESLNPQSLKVWKETAHSRERLRGYLARVSADDLLSSMQLTRPDLRVSADYLHAIEVGSAVPKPEEFEAILHLLGNAIGARQADGKVARSIAPIQKELLRRVSISPQKVFELQPREFEELVAEILDKMGLEVRLTPQTRDGGRDILATFQSPVGELLTIVECKRYSPENPVGIAIVERMLYTIREKDRASLGMIVTTSRFSEDAAATAARYQYQLLLRDYGHLREWLRQYGTYVEEPTSGLWLPSIFGEDT